MTVSEEKHNISQNNENDEHDEKIPLQHKPLPPLDVKNTEKNTEKKQEERSLGLNQYLLSCVHSVALPKSVVWHCPDFITCCLNHRPSSWK
jgi:hypothetical protein